MFYPLSCPFRPWIYFVENLQKDKPTHRYIRIMNETLATVIEGIGRYLYNRQKFRFGRILIRTVVSLYALTLVEETRENVGEGSTDITFFFV